MSTEAPFPEQKIYKMYDQLGSELDAFVPRNHHFREIKTYSEYLAGLRAEGREAAFLKTLLTAPIPIAPLRAQIVDHVLGERYQLGPLREAVGNNRLLSANELLKIEQSGPTVGEIQEAVLDTSEGMVRRMKPMINSPVYSPDALEYLTFIRRGIETMQAIECIGQLASEGAISEPQRVHKLNNIYDDLAVFYPGADPEILTGQMYLFPPIRSLSDKLTYNYESARLLAVYDQDLIHLVRTVRKPA